MNYLEEALEELRDFKYGKDKLLVCQTQQYHLLKQAIARLNNYDEMLSFSNGSLMAGFDNKYGKQIVAMPLEEYDEFMKQEKAFEIIKNKEVDIHLLKACISCFTDALYAYNSEIKKLHSNHKDYQNKPLRFYQLTEEEFNLLKEVLE